MKRLLSVALGVLTAIGGFVDIGDLVANGLIGARFGFSLAWVVLVGIVGICLYAEMAGRIAAVSGRAVFDLVRERLGVRFAFLNLLAAMLINFLTLVAEIAGVALAVELASGLSYFLFLPVVGAAVWLIVWKVRFSTMENAFGLAGLCLIAFLVALLKLGPDWSSVAHQVLHPAVPSGEGHPTYFYYAIALFGAAMTPYEVFFFSSGGVEERWSRKDLVTERVNVFVGFPLGGLLSLSIMGCAALLLQPAGISVEHMSQISLPVSAELGKAGLAIVIIGFVAATGGAAMETALSTGYAISQFFGWQWGKLVAPRSASLFHLTVLIAVIAATAVGLTTVDPVKVTEYSIVFSAMALPLTYLPILVIANDPDYLGQSTNSRFTNTLGSIYLVVLVVASIAAIPLMLATKAGL